ncbi:RNA polymerase II transcription factor B subunit 4 [Phyllosticta capitalensis]
MEAVDATQREYKGSDGPPPSLLTVVFDTNPHAWAYLSSSLPLSKAIANLLVFINAHLAMNSANQVAVIASHSQKTAWLYPTPNPPKGRRRPVENGQNGRHTDVDGDVEMSDASKQPISAEDANKYRPFRKVETEILTNLRKLTSQTLESDLRATTTTMIAGALTAALAYISKATLKSAPTSNDANAADILAPSSEGSTQRTTLTSRILVISVSGDLASQYIAVMNSIFAAQRQRIPIDILKLAGDTILLQQACDATGGIYMKPSAPQGLLQYLMMAFLPDKTARKHLVLPSAGEVDFRAACFCHRRVVDVGYVCSVCLSIFCEPLADQTCLTCGSKLSVSTTASKPPALLARKKKKRKRAPGESTPAATPGGGATPIPS